jgi:lysylphosphatidylglycerol synthetase-like protein (DUF2156 family)
VVEELVVDLPLGARLLVFAGLRLGTTPTEASAMAAEEVARAIGSWDGPGAVMIAGDLLSSELQGGAAMAAALDSHPTLASALQAFTSLPGRRVVVMPGRDEAWLTGAVDTAAAGTAPERTAGAVGTAADRTTAAGTAADRTAGVPEALARLGVEVAERAVAEMRTGTGVSRVLVEPGQPAAWATDGTTRRDIPLLGDVVPGVWRGRTSGWLAGMKDLDDPAALPRFVASRLVYRQFGRRAWLLALPVLLAILLLRLPASLLGMTRAMRGAIVLTAVAMGAVELAVVLVIGAVFLRQIWLALSGQAGGPRDLNEPARARSRALVSRGWAGLVSGGTHGAELSAHRVAAVDGSTRAGFYANPGCCGDVVSEVPPRLGGFGLPSPFLAKRHIGWVELEAGNEMHARLLHGELAMAGATLAERFLARRPDLPAEEHRGRWRSSPKGSGPRPQVMASFPLGPSWPALSVRHALHRRARRMASLVVGLAGFMSLVVALSAPLAHRLRLLRQFVPLVVPQAAGVLACLAGLGLLVLAAGIRRGQRRAYVVCQATLIATGVLDLVHATSIATSAIAFSVAGFLWLNRASFQAASDVPPLRPLWRGVGTLLGVFAASVLAGCLALEASSWYSVTLRHHRPDRIAWGQAFLATIERMGGVRHVPLPDPLDDFFSAAMFAVTAAIVLAAAWMAFRPVVARWPRAERGLERAREVVRHYGSGTLDYFALRSDKQFFFWGGTVVAYAVYSGTCLVSPDPVGPTAEREGAWRAFREFVDRHGWSLAVLGAAEDWLPVYRSTGMRDLYVGDEAVVRVGRFSLEGGRFKGLRQAVNRVARYGYTISFHDPARVGPELAAELNEVMTRSRRGGVERGFSMTLGRICDPRDEGLLLAVVRAPDDGRPVAFCQYVPAPAIAGYSLDLMRRDNGDHPNGLIDFAVVETIVYLREHGYDGLGLNFATMRAVLAGEAGEGAPKRVQAWLLRRMSGAMQIESLWRFNAKFDPDWQPRYAVYDSPEHALPAALAVARAESFWELPLIGRFLIPSPQRQPDGAGLETLVGRSVPPP